MKQTLTLLLFVLGLCVLAPETFAQPKHAISLRNVFYNYETPRATDPGFWDIYKKSPGMRGIEIAYQRRIDHNTYFVFPLKFGIASMPRNSVDRNARPETIGNFDWLVQRQFFKYGNFINPYLHFGLGTTYRFKHEEWNLNIPMGAGLNFRLGEDFYLSVQSQYRASERKHDGWQHGVGFTIFFGGVNDRDKDGVKDEEDRCPDVFGLKTLAGCPDRDGDGVTDGDDKCPDTPGLPTLAGCPDKDGDGITDADDECPTEAGVAAFNGCPDTDGDGLADKNDKCPKEAGPVANGGCPILDRDGDGINDKDDACPDAKGPAATKGCPDRDADNIADRDDACPDVKGTAAGRGCPDSDGDGMYDNEDKCPTAAGPRSNKGCPELTKEEKAKLENVIKNVQFETGKAVLLKKSYAVLDEVVALMVKYPEYKLRISGHTDNVGDDKFNQTLSENRAKACYDYLVSKGVVAARMSHTGYGETRPVGDNKTKAGRDMNRRVDFELYVP